MHRLLASCFVLALLLTALARVAHADTLDDETRRIARQLQCPVCAGASVADSPSDLAGQMRTVIRARLQAGESEEQIIAYFVERYGDGVLIEPPRRGVGLAVWLVPLAMLAIGSVLLWRLLRSWLRPRPAPSLVTGASAVASPGVHPPPEPYRNGTVYADGPARISSVDRARAELDRLLREG